jgi:hypothetical protein
MLLGELLVVADHQHAADHVGMAVEVFGRRVHDHVGAVFQRALQHRRAEGVVDRQDQPCSRANAARRAISTIFSIGLVGVSPRSAWCSAHAAFSAAGSFRSTKLKSSPASGGARVRTGGRCRRRHRPCDDVAARVEHVEHGRWWPPGPRRRHSRACRLPARRRSAPRRSGSGCASASTRSPGARPGSLHVGAGGVDRRHHRAGGRVGRLAGVDGAGAEAVVVVVAHVAGPSGLLHAAAQVVQHIHARDQADEALAIDHDRHMPALEQRHQRVDRRACRPGRAW